MLRIAVPNKGSLSEPAVAMLGEAGYRRRRDPKELVLRDPANDVEFFYLRPKDIATYVGKGQLDAGITGRDLLLDSGARAEESLALGFGRSTFRLAAPIGTMTNVGDVAGKRIATSHTGLTRRWLDGLGVEAEVVRLDGAVENSIGLGVADAITDVVSTGTTLRRAGLETIGDAIQASEAILIRRVDTSSTAQLDQLHRRLQGVLIARQYVVMDYDVRVETLDHACTVTPGLEAPTISPLHKDGWVAVRAMVGRADSHRIMDELWELGARGILVTDIHACRL